MILLIESILSVSLGIEILTGLLKLNKLLAKLIRAEIPFSKVSSKTTVIP